MRAKFKIPLSIPNLTREDFSEISRCFNSTWISSKSPWVEKFERAFGQKVSGTKYAVSVNSATSALFLALKSLRVGKGDEVIIPSFTMIATINAVTLSGAEPVLVDCASSQDWNIGIEEMGKKISPRTKVIIPVHIYGYPCKMDRILKIAKEAGLWVIEDAAEAMGATYKGKKAGSFGHLSCFSLYANKIITTANGGVVATNIKRLYEDVKSLSFFDFNAKTHFMHHMIGYNFVLSGLQAALGVSQLRRFNKLLTARRRTYRTYLKHLGRSRGLKFVKPGREENPTYWFPAVLFESRKIKEYVRLGLEKKGIETRNFFVPIHLQPVYKNLFKNEKFPNSEFFYQRGLLLPSYYDLTEEQIKLICSYINDLLSKIS